MKARGGDMVVGAALDGAGNRYALTLLSRQWAQRKAMFSEMDAEERDALQVIGRSAVCGNGRCLVDGSPSLEGIRIGAAGAGVEQFKECSSLLGCSCCKSSKKRAERAR